MQGKNHVATNTAILLATISFSSSLPVITERLMPNEPTIITGITYSVIGYFCFVFGSLLPDIDTPHSTLGEYLYIPVQHRTWTHSIWFILLFVWLGTKNRFFAWMAIGVILHILIDVFSYSGLNIFYPISFRRSKAADGHIFRFYKVGGSTEYIFMTFIFCISIYLIGRYGILGKGIVNFWA